jgi:hypothetical protein
MRRIAVLVAVGLAGCGEAPLWSGTYTSTGTWKLSGPLEGGRTVGDAAADLLLDEVVSAAPVPSFLESKLRDWLSDALRNPVKQAVDSRVPKDLAPDGALTLLLGETLASVQIESTITLGGDTDELEGNEAITAIELVVRGQRRRLSAAALGAPGVAAEWAGQESGAGALSIEPHSLKIRYGALVQLAMTELLAASELTTLQNDLRSALGCEALLAAMLGGKQGLELSIATWSYTISAASLSSSCESAMSAALGRAVGQFELDSHVEVGGSVSWTATSASSPAELRSGSDFGGIVAVLPRAIAPRVTVAFEAHRQ